MIGNRFEDRIEYWKAFSSTCRYRGRDFTLIIPVRCFSCGTLIGDKWEEFSRRVSSGEDPSAVLTSLGLKRPCCRRMLISNIDFIDELIAASASSSSEASG